jgi:hypothetical protein
MPAFCLQEEPDEHGQGKWEGKQEGKSASFLGINYTWLNSRTGIPRSSLDVYYFNLITPPGPPGQQTSKK